MSVDFDAIVKMFRAEKSVPPGVLLFIPHRQPYETDEELARRCVMLKNLATEDRAGESGRSEKT